MIMQRHKIALVGSGQIGGTLAHLLTQKELGDVVLIDVMEGIPQGKGLDLHQACAISHSNSCITGSQDYASMKDADVVIVTAGIARKPGMSRDDLLSTNTQVMVSVGENIKKYAPHAFVIVVTNPLDVMVWVMKQASSLPSHKVVGMAGVLDSARYRTFLSDRLKVSVNDIQAFVLGGHGDSMVPMPRYTTVSGIPLAEIIAMGWITQAEVDAIIDRTRNGGAEIVNLLKTGSAFYAPAESAVQMAASYLKGQRRILPCAVQLNGEYGLHDLYMGVPVVIGANGVEKIIELSLTPQEQAFLNTSASGVRALIEDVKRLNILK